MKLNAGIVTKKLEESKAFYTDLLDFEVLFENDFYLLLGISGQGAAISFLQPNHPSQEPIFQKPFKNKGMFLTIEMDNVDKLYQELKAKGVEFEIDIRDEPWGDRHFAIVDPNGIGVDLVKYTPPQEGN